MRWVVVHKALPPCHPTGIRMHPIFVAIRFEILLTTNSCQFRIRVSGCCLCSFAPHMSLSHCPILAEADEGAPDSHICPCSRHHGMSRSRSGGFNTVANGSNFHHLYCDPYHKDLRSGGPGPTDDCLIQGSEPGCAHGIGTTVVYI